MALGSTQPWVKMSTRNISGGKGGRCVRLTTSPLSRAECHEIWEPKRPGTLWATPGLLRDCCTFTFTLPPVYTRVIQVVTFLYADTHACAAHLIMVSGVPRGGLGCSTRRPPPPPPQPPQTPLSVRHWEEWFLGLSCNRLPPNCRFV
jgi:hypothetical protein